MSTNSELDQYLRTIGQAESEQDNQMILLWRSNKE